MTTRIHTRRPMAMRLAAAAAALSAVLLGAAPAGAQGRNQECIERYNAVAGTTVFNPADAQQLRVGCQLVAVAVTSEWSTRQVFESEVDPRHLAATRDQTTAAPGDVTAPVEPVEAAGGSVAAVGTDRGAGAVAAIALNPSIFFVDPSDTEAVARWSRITDVTLLVPVSETDGDGSQGEDDDGSETDYVGIRWGLSLTGHQQGGELHRAVVEAYNAFLASEGAQTRKVQGLLAAAPAESLESCIRLLNGVQALDADMLNRLTATCGGSPLTPDSTVIPALRKAIQAARIRADSRYLGLDLRADFGDLSLAGVDTVFGTALFAGIGWGRRSVRAETDASTGIRAHLGVRHWNADDQDDDARTAVEGGVGFELIRFYNYQRLSLVGGLDAQHRTGGEAEDDEATSLTARGSLNVPITPTASVSVNLAAPLKGERRGPVLSIKANWRLLRSLTF